MKKSWAMKWARDLETTSARQAIGTLNNGKGGFCCLGRLCVIVGKRGVRQGLHEMAYDQETGVLPVSVMQIVGMRTDTGEFDNGALSELNDSGIKFPELAKLIRKRWKDL